MSINLKEHHRRSIRLKEYDYSQPGGYFVTIVTFQRDCWVAKQQWEKLPKRFPNVELSTFVVMPNHVHGIIVLNGRGTAGSRNAYEEGLTRRTPTERFGKPILRSIPTIVRSYKSAVSYRINLMRGTKNIPIWQRNYVSCVLSGLRTHHL